MAIGYTPLDWVDGGAPAISAANLDHLEGGTNAACGRLDVAEAGINDAIAVAAVAAATVGARLVGKITEAGYSLSPATGADNLDNIADGATYKRVQAAKATAINAVAAATATKTNSAIPVTSASGDLNAFVPAAWLSSSGTGGSDGNSGQPPAPKPTASAGMGQWVDCTRYIGGSALATGQWAFLNFDASGAYQGSNVAAGGLDMGAGIRMMCYKVIA